MLLPKIHKAKIKNNYKISRLVYNRSKKNPHLLATKKIYTKYQEFNFK